MKQFDVLLHDAEVKLKRLKALYEQWFQGIERLEPTVPRKDLDRLFQTLNKEKPRNTAARFKLQQLQARYNVYVSYWQRIARQIEEGTYERDLRRVRRRRGGMAASPAEANTYELDVDVDIDEIDDLDDEIASVLSALDTSTPREPSPPPRRALSAFSPFAMGGKKPSPAAAKASNDETSPGTPNPFDRGGGTGRVPVTSRDEKPFAKQPVTATFGKPKTAARPAPPSPPKPASPAKPTPRRPSASGPSRPAVPRPPGRDDGTRKIYDAYVDARRRNNERVDNVAYDKMADSIQKMRSRLEAKHGSKKKIDFEVVVQNGRVGLKPKIE